MRTLSVVNMGSFIGKKSERLIVREKDNIILEEPFFRIREVVISKRGISLSSDVIAEAVSSGISLYFMDQSGKPYAMLSSPMMSGVISTRRQQILAYYDSRSVQAAKILTIGKVVNQANLLRYFVKSKTVSGSLKSVVSEQSSSIINIARQIKSLYGEKIDDVRDRIMGFEGAAGKIYWSGISSLLSAESFAGREHRGATDKVNSMLNYGYGILYGRVWNAVLLAGLEPFAGFLHVDRSGKPSLVLDLVEEFRAPVVDRTVIAMINQKVKIEKEPNNQLTAASRSLLASRVLERLAGQVTFQGRKMELGSLIQCQARNFAAFLLGSRKYKSYRFKW